MQTIDARTRHRAQRTRWLEWAALTIVAVALVLVLDRSGLLRGPNRLIQDALISAQGRDVSQSEVVIVGIDDKSIAALGKWPWRRSFHAALIDNIDKDAPLAIGMDLLLIEPDERFPGDDAALADALSRSDKVVLPLMMQILGGEPIVVKPIPGLALNAKGLGHVHLAMDDDGVARTVYLREGLSNYMRDNFSVAMLAASGKPIEPRHLPGHPDVGADMQNPMSGQVLAWRRSHKMTVPFAGPSGHFRHVSYVDVLDGLVPPGTFKGKYVLIGATAAGLGDLYATPVLARSQLMSGVEISANVLDSLLGNHRITPASAWLNAAFNTIAVLLALVGLAFLGPLPALLLTALLIVALPTATAASTVLFRLQFAPVAGMFGLGLTYALWSWRRLDAATRYLIDEVTQLRMSGRMVPITIDDPASTGDFLDSRINLLKQATLHLRGMHRLVSDSLEGLPDPILVCDRMGIVLLANAAAARHFRVASGENLCSASVLTLMCDVLSQGDQQPVVSATAFTQQPSAMIVTAARDRLERDLLVKQAPLFSGSGTHTGWILSLVDVTEMRQVQRRCDDAMRFLSHDMRAPQASILTLLTLHQQNPSAMTEEQFHVRIERHARKALALSDGFIQLMRAQSYAYHFQRHDLVNVLLECIDDAWEAARRRQTQIIMTPSPQEGESLIDRELVARAIGNLLGNALKFSPEGTSITCAVESHESGWAVLVQDQGPGIAEDVQLQMFQPFTRSRTGAHTDGAGLGLAFVKTVAQRHGGKVLVDSTPGHGSAFRLVLPRAS